MLFIGLVIGVAVLTLGLFAAVILWWERREEAAEKRAGR